MMNSGEGFQSGSRDRDGSGSDEESGPESAESSRSTLTLVPAVRLLRCWCIKGMQEEDVQLDDRGQHVPFLRAEDSCVKNFVPMLCDTMARYILD